MTPQEIKALRKRLKLNQKEFGKEVGASLRTVQNWEKGDTQPSADKLIKLQALQKGDDYSLKTTIHESDQVYVTNKNGNIFKELPDGNYDVQVPVIPFSAYAGYLESLETGTVQEDFETTIFKVDRIGRGNYKAFVVRGDSMNGGRIDDTKDGSTVLGRELGRHHWKDGFNPTPYGWIILSKQNIFHKDITGYDPESGNITCHSRNTSPEYADFTINLNDIYQIFKVIKRTF